MNKKNLLIAAFALFSSLAALAQPPAGDAKPGDWYGTQVSAQDAVHISEVPALLANKESISTKVRAKVLDVCPKKGCWMKLAVNDSTTAFVRMKDYAFFMPLAVKGKTVVLDADAKWFTPPIEEAQHYAKDAKKTQAEIDAIKQPQKEIRFMANGVVVVE